jgi:hypothetical protein
MEQCFLCRRWMTLQEVRRRVLPVSQSQGVTLSAVPGVCFFVHTAPVSVCPACDDALATRRPGIGGWIVTIGAGLVIVATLLWLAAAIIDGIGLAWHAGHWKVAIFLSGLILWRGARLVRRIGSHRMQGNSLIEVGNPPSLER